MSNPALQPGLNVADATDLSGMWTTLPRPQAIITSPPYLDMHDYGNSSQIGVRGQSADEYLDQMGRLFRECHDIAAPDATFWLIAGSVRRNKRLILLRDLLADRAERAGWTLRESIVWDKQKALPWTHHGELRDITEQVLLFSKSDDFKFYANDLRSPIPNSVWWRRYPERYSPDGTMPTNLWSIQIPTQGAWSGLRTHFCPFPEELTYRMLSLTTDSGDTVLDPLAGIGSVPAMATAMDRVGYGLELTEESVELYNATLKSAKAFISHLRKDEKRRDTFHRTIIRLRLLKFARLLAGEIKEDGTKLLWVRVAESDVAPVQKHHVTSATFELVTDPNACLKSITNAATAAAKRAPLSKFGIDAQIIASFLTESSMDGYWYRSGRFWEQPDSHRPSDGEPHVVANFDPQPDLVDDMPYV